MMKKIFEIVMVVGLILIIFSANTGATGIAVSPSKIEMTNVLKGTEHDRALTVFNTGTSEDTFSLNATGGISDWISFYCMEDPIAQIDNITIPAKDKALILVKLAIPDDAANGEYSSKIYVQSIPPEVGGGQAAVMIKMPVGIKINVTGTQILTGVVKSITIRDTEVNYPQRINVEFQNTGNVVAKPEIAVKIVKNETIIDRFTYAEARVKVDSKETIPVEWDTTGKESGGYVANVTVSLNGDILATKDLPFTLLPVGTLSRRGNLTDISYDGEPGVGRVIKILATFVNTGEIETKAEFIGEVSRDNNLVDVINSKELSVPVGTASTLTSYLKIENPGNYVIKGRVVYDGKETATKEISFNVPAPEPEAQKEEQTPFVPGFESVLAIAALLVIGYLIMRKRNEKK